MKSLVRNCVVLVFLAAVALSCSSSEDPVMVQIGATSLSGDPIEVSYETPAGLITEVVDSPWTLLFEEPEGDYSVSVVTRNLGDGEDEVTCRILGVAGSSRPYKSEGEASAICDVSVQVSGDSTRSSSLTQSSEFARRDDGSMWPFRAEQRRLPAADSLFGARFGDLLPFSNERGVGTINTATQRIELVDSSVDGWVDLYIDADGMVYASDCGEDWVKWFPLGGGSSEVELAIECPNEVVVVGEVLWVPLVTEDAVVRIDLATSEEISRTATMDSPSVVGVLGELVYVGSSETTMLQTFSAQTGELIDEIDVGATVGGLTVDSERERLILDLGIGSALLDVDGLTMVEAEYLVVSPSGELFGSTDAGFFRVDSAGAMVGEPVLGPEGGLRAAGDDYLFVSRRGNLITVSMNIFD